MVVDAVTSSQHPLPVFSNILIRLSADDDAADGGYAKVLRPESRSPSLHGCSPDGICHTDLVRLLSLITLFLQQMPHLTKANRPRALALSAALLCAVVAPADANVIQVRAEDHLEQALEDGLEPVDAHHLLLLFAWRHSLPDWSWVHTALDRLTSAPGQVDPLMADEIRLLRSQIAVDEGHAAAAREYFRAMGGLERWWAHGPLDLGELEDFSSLAVLPEAGVEWRSVPGTDPVGWVALEGLAWPAQRQLLYLATTLTSEQAQPVAVRIGAAQVARVWLNGAEVLTTPYPLQRGEDQAAGGGWLRAGSNRLCVVVASESSDWWLRTRLTAPDGSPLVGVREVDTAPQPQQLEERAGPQIRTLEAEIRKALDQGWYEANLALAAFMVTRHPEATTSGAIRSACRQARVDSPSEARLLEWLITSEPKAARDLLEQAVEADPDGLMARIPLAHWYSRRGLRERAVELLNEAGPELLAQATILDLDAEVWGPMVLPQLATLSRQAPQCVVLARLLAERAIDAGYWLLVEEAMARLEAVVPTSSKVLRLREGVAADCGDSESLKQLLAEQLEHDRNRPALRVRLARLLTASDQPDAARSLIQEGLRRCPNHADLLTELARLEHAEGNDDAAVELARQLLKARPQDRQARRLLARLDDEDEDLSWLRSPDQLWQLADQAPDSKPAVALLEHHEVRFLPGQLSEERVQRALLITSAEQADHLLQHTLGHVPERQALRVLSARILRRDGSEIAARQSDTPRLSEPEINMYYDTRLRVLRFTELEDGDLIEISYILSETAEANETGPYKGGLVVLGKEIPVVLAEVELAGSEELLPQWELANLTGTPTRIEADGMVHLRFEWHDIPALPRETPAPPPLVVIPHLAYSNHPEWPELADWYARHVAPRIRTSRQVEETAKRLTRNLQERRNKINALYRFVTNEIDYVGLELGEHRFRPFSADWVLNHRIGDCKDKTALLVALLRVIEVPARMALIRSADLGPVTAEIALLQDFNHVIAYLPEDDLWLDGTANGHDMTFPPALDQNAMTFIVDGPSSRPRTTPIIGAGRSHYWYTLGRDESGGIKLGLKVEDTGNAASRRRAQLGGSHDPRRLSRWLQDLFPAADLTSEPRVEMTPSRDPSVLELQASVPRATLLSGGGIRTYPGRLGLVRLFTPTDLRSTPLLIPVGPDTYWSLTVDLQRVPKELPEDVDLDTPFGSLWLKFTSEARGYRVDGELHLEAGLVQPEEVKALREFLVAVERHLERPLEVP
jgi:transglutaminase-like putative cysteine protease/Tfp pilus assembly protein PilF